MLAPIWPSRRTALAGGEKAKSSFTWMETVISRRSVAPAPKITSVVPGISSNRRASTARTPLPFWDCLKSSSPMVFIAASSALACIAGTSWTRFALRKICASPSRLLAGAVAIATYHSRMISPQPPSGTRANHTRRIQTFQTLIAWKSSPVMVLARHRHG